MLVTATRGYFPSAHYVSFPSRVREPAKKEKRSFAKNCLMLPNPLLGVTMIMNQQDQQFLINLAQQAGELASQHADKLQIENKADGSLVTDADRKTEQLIRTGLGEHWPDDAIVGEEIPDRVDSGAQNVWYVDPIDGTHNFIAGLPLWAVCIGRCTEGVPTTGVIHAPALGLTWTGFEGQGARLNGAPVSVPDCTEIVRSDMIAFTTEAIGDLRLDLPHGQRNLGSAALHCGYLATGAFVACLFSNWLMWDVVPGFAIAAEAGATACNLAGQPITTFAGFAARDRHEPIVLAADSCCKPVAAHTTQPRPPS